MVEAIPHKFVECVRNRPNSIVEHCALVASDFKIPYVEICYSNLMSYAPALTNIDQRKQIDLGADFLFATERKLSHQVFLAPARTLKDTLLKYDIRHIDLMVLDLEGAELGALRGLDFDVCRVENILIEARDLQAVDSFLSDHGFRRHAEFSNCHDFFYRRV